MRHVTAVMARAAAPMAIHEAATPAEIRCGMMAPAMTMPMLMP